MSVGCFDEELDVLVVGSGIAGLCTAVALAGRRKVAVVSKQYGGGSTELAQGGIAVANAWGDSAQAHAADTLTAAAGLGDAQVAALVTGEAKGALKMLSDLGVRFDNSAPAREGGHSKARVVHARGDATGSAISAALLAAARRRGVQLLHGFELAKLLVEGGRSVGALFFGLRSGEALAVRAANVVLATGGYGQLWEATTSPAECNGSGLEAALRAGAQVADLEFVQFHPTGMALGRDPRPLATEALRGAGARLRDAAGDYLHQDGGDLAARDVVSVSMARRMAELGASHCYLDATCLGRARLEAHFPTFVAACESAGIDPAREWAPVSPTAHYTMGGVLTDSYGRTTLEGLLAVGEVACSGLHGANRLASNSLLEGAVLGRRAAEAILGAKGPVPPRERVEPLGLLAGPPAPGSEPTRAQLRCAMQRWAGVFRDGEGLSRLVGLLAGSSWVARAVAVAALRREESRGAHRRADFAEPDARWLVRQVLELLPGGELVVGEMGVGQVEVAGAAAVFAGAAPVRANVSS
jgi:aspartate oxidase